MHEGYYALTLAILAPHYITPERAFPCLEAGKLDSETRCRTITAADINEMKQLSQSWMRNCDIAEKFSVDKSTVSRAIKREATHEKRNH